MDCNDKAFDFAQETTKQLLSLATGLIALTVTFGKDFVHHVGAGPRCVAVAAWVILLLSVFCGITTLMALTGTLGKTPSDGVPSVYAGNVTIMGMLQAGFFFIGLLLTVVFGVWAAMS